MARIFLGAYWAQRKESRESSAQRVTEFMASVEQADPSLSEWYPKGRSKKSATPIVLSSAAISEKLRTNKRDMTGEVIVELGFSFSAWNGKAADLSIALGAHCAEVGNSVVLSSESPLSEQVWRALSEAAIRAFDPDSLVVTSHTFIEKHGGGMPWQAGGWFTYKRGGELQQHDFSK